MKYTDETGQEYESLGTSNTPGVISIVPVKAQPKWYVGNPVLMYDGADYTFAVTFPATKDQAQLIKQSVVLLMDFLFGDTPLHRVYFKDFHDKLEAARAALEDNNG